MTLRAGLVFLLRFLALESLVTFSTMILYYKYNFSFVTCVSLAFCLAFFFGMADYKFFGSKTNKKE